MKMFIILAVFFSPFCAKSQNWTSWQPLGYGLEISYKYSKYNDCSSYHFVRIRNNSANTYCYVRVSFDTYCRGKKNEYRETVSQNRMKPGEILESRGNWFLGTGGASNAKIDRLTDYNCKKLIGQ